MTFSIRVFDPDGNPAIVPASLDVQVQAHSAVDVGGMWDADIAINGALEELAGLTAWLGYRLEILNEYGTAVWWGDVVTVEVTADGARRGVSLERMANRVQVRYAQRQPGGGAASADTDWFDNALSQDSYGVWERRISPPREMSAAEADAYAATALAALGEPHYTLAVDGGQTAARIYCAGFWRRLARRYYSQDMGLAEHAVGGNAAPLGLGFTSSAVAFVARTDEIHSITGLLTNFRDGMRVRVSGANQAGNNGAWLLDSGGDDRAAVSYVSSAVTWSANDDILDANGGLGFIENDDAFTVAGASNAIHNGTQLMDKAGAAAVEASNAYRGGNFTSESAGAAITFKRGNKVAADGSLTNEHAGANVTVTAWGQKQYQPFQIPSMDAWTAAYIELRLRRVGNPSDNVTVQLVTDSAGVPGAVAETVSVSAANIPADMGWVSFALLNTTALNPGTVYGLTVSRSGANDPANYYEIDLDEDAGYGGGALRQWDGATWQTPSPAQDMAFRVLGARDTGAQAGLILDDADFAAIDVVDSNVTAHQWRDGETRAIDEIGALLEMGTLGGYRLLARVQRSGAAQVYQQPDKALARWVYRGERLYDLHGREAEPGFLPAGEWVQLGDAANLGPWARLSPVFLERAEWRGDSLSIEPQGTADIYESGVRQG